MTSDTHTDTSNPIPPVTEDDIASYLVNNQGFFERHAQVLSSIQLSSPHGNRAVSLQERQAMMLREKIRLLEQRIMEMIRHSTENMGIAAKTHAWTLSMLCTNNPMDIPDRIVEEVRERYSVPQATIKVWDVHEPYRCAEFAQGASEDAQLFAASLTSPFCGANLGFEAVQWLQEPENAKSLALLPLREGTIQNAGSAFGLLVLASPDPLRFAAGMGTSFLEQMAEIASAALMRLRE